MARQIKKIIIYNSDGTIDVEEYDESGRLVHAIDSLSPTETQELFFSDTDYEAVSSKGGALPPDEYTHDEQGRLVEEVVYLPNCNDAFTGGDTSSKYIKLLHVFSDHDEHGNWLASLNYELEADGTKRLIDTTRREIEYY